MGTLVMESGLVTYKISIKMLLADLKKIQDNSYNVEINSVVKNDVRYHYFRILVYP